MDKSGSYSLKTNLDLDVDIEANIYEKNNEALVGIKIDIPLMSNLAETIRALGIKEFSGIVETYGDCGCSLFLELEAYYEDLTEVTDEVMVKLETIVGQG